MAQRCSKPGKGHSRAVSLTPRAALLWRGEEISDELAVLGRDVAAVEGAVGAGLGVGERAVMASQRVVRKLREAGKTEARQIRDNGRCSCSN